MHQILPLFECLKEPEDKSLLSFYQSGICVKLNETKLLNIFHLKYILNTWFQLKIHKNYFLSVLALAKLSFTITFMGDKPLVPVLVICWYLY